MKTLSSHMARSIDALLAPPMSFVTVFVLTSAAYTASIWYTANHSVVAMSRVTSFGADFYVISAIVLALTSLILGDVMTRRSKPLAAGERWRLHLLQIMAPIAGIMLRNLGDVTLVPCFPPASVTVGFAAVASARLMRTSPWSFAGCTGSLFFLGVLIITLRSTNRTDLVVPFDIFLDFGTAFSFIAMAISIPLEVIIRAVMHRISRRETAVVTNHP